MAWLYSPRAARMHHILSSGVERGVFRSPTILSPRDTSEPEEESLRGRGGGRGRGARAAPAADRGRGAGGDGGDADVHRHQCPVSGDGVTEGAASGETRMGGGAEQRPLQRPRSLQRSLLRPTAHPGLAGRRPLCHPITGHRTLVAVHVSITTIPSGSATAVRRRRRARASPAAAAAPSQALLLRLRRIPGGKDRWRTKYASLDSAREDMVHTRGARAVQPCHRLSRLGARRFVWVHTVAGGGARRYFSRCSCR